MDISGTVIEYEARNPHSYLHIAAVDENGKTQEYVCESHGVHSAHAQRHHAGDAETGHGVARRRLVVAA